MSARTTMKWKTLVEIVEIYECVINDVRVVDTFYYPDIVYALGIYPNEKICERLNCSTQEGVEFVPCQVVAKSIMKTLKTIIQEEIDALERELREKIEQHKNDKVVEELTKYEEHTLRRMKKEILNEIVSYSVDNSANTI